MKSPAGIVTLFIILVLMHLAAVHFYLYWTVWWFDIIMHVLGGLIAGLLVAHGVDGSRPKLLVSQIIAAVVIGILWEIYEYKSGATFVTQGMYVIDTVSDLLCDIAGGLVAYLAVFSNKLSYEQKS